MRGSRLADLERAICEETPPSPSAAVAAAMQSSPAEIAEIADQRSSSPSKLRRDLKGDLDNIVAMATRKEPERRYASVEQFAADVDNLLSGMPIARPDAWTYRTGKFSDDSARRRTVTRGYLRSLVGFTVTTYMQARRIAFERDNARTSACWLNQNQRAEAVSTFLIDSFRLADPSQSRGDAITAREILDRGARHLD